MQAFYALCQLLKVSQGTLSMKCLSMDWTVPVTGRVSFFATFSFQIHFGIDPLCL